MTRNLHQDPNRRCKPLEEWPETDRRLWQAALVPGDLLAEGGSRARYTENTNSAMVYTIHGSVAITATSRVPTETEAGKLEFRISD
jgi:hypothetical protein